MTSRISTGDSTKQMQSSQCDSSVVKRKLVVGCNRKAVRSSDEVNMLKKQTGAVVESRKHKCINSKSARCEGNVKNDKLKFAIDHFDKILNEYGAESAIKSKPKLQKAKTCSIIESKCILKKGIARSDSATTLFVGQKTQSMQRLMTTTDAEEKQQITKNIKAKVDFINKNKSKESINILRKKDNIKPATSNLKQAKNTKSTITCSANNATKTVVSKGLKVKEIQRALLTNNSHCESKVKTFVKRINSQPVSSPFIINSKQQLSKPKQASKEVEIVKGGRSLSISSSSTRKPTTLSKIPISRELNKSIPNGLNVDRNLSSAFKTKSMLNLNVTTMTARKGEVMMSRLSQCNKSQGDISKLNDNFGSKKRIFEAKFAVASKEKPSAVFQQNDSKKKPFEKSDSGIELSGSSVKTNYSSDENSDDSGNMSSGVDEPKQQSFSRSESILQKKSSEIFFRSRTLTDLESQRDEKLAGMVVHLQAHCRGHLARKKLVKKKLQDLAVRCIQRNVRKFMLVRDWPWWRLLVRVSPLLNVHRTEEQLRQKSEELDLLKTKLDKVESERTMLKHENDKLESKMMEISADLAEEHSTSTLAAERLDAETNERIRLERELSETQHKNKQLQQASERLEMELLYARSDLDGISEEDDEGEGEGVFKQRYERVVKELEFTKRRLQQQHEDDLEQLVGLKKQLEKKLSDAYEEVEEQRQVVGQWKRKVQKLNGEMNDLKHLLEEQGARNNLLEKKQRKFDSETQLMQDELRQEKILKERVCREKELCMAEKFTLESNIADIKLELELKDEKLAAFQSELDELTYGGKTEEEVTLLRKQKIDCERRLHDQEEELDELAGQVQLLEQAKLKLEMNLEQMRKTGKKEAQLHDEELEEVRCNAQKKVKSLEAQLENEHEERTILLREKHDLERRLMAAMENDNNEKACDEALLQRLKRDLKRTKALLRDTQTQLERMKAETPGKAMIRQLKNQLEDIECARSLAAKAKQTLEVELSETQSLLEESNRQRNDAEDKLNAVNRERSDMQSQLEENEEELAEVLKKYKASVSQMSLDQLALQEQVSLVTDLEIERNSLREQLAELTTKLESVESMGDASSNLVMKRMELKLKELESKLELEQTTKSRLDVQISRLKEVVDKLQTDLSNARLKEQNSQDQVRKLQRNLREIRDELNSAMSREGETLLKRKELEKRCEELESETATARTDLRLALKRIEDLQSAIQGDLDDDDSMENSDSEHDSYSSDDSVNTFLAAHNKEKNDRRFSTASSSGGKESGSYA
ncbi:PREDICTED: unconventional myosin-XVIIIa isoform X3 [Nicrophorus vespilloides]|uniref:Unconventional myosin-XVIIIa isoform X3 n=1 Tax=Nicrophorus vespilloides TaxID=110193 RepID=A0ABM1MAN1_NICVS|nr:PREDICTED: unconventional myosin-XVIIIa isoform X3 [Nicrophorus vespilloides]